MKVDDYRKITIGDAQEIICASDYVIQSLESIDNTPSRELSDGEEYLVNTGAIRRKLDEEVLKAECIDEGVTSTVNLVMGIACYWGFAELEGDSVKTRSERNNRFELQHNLNLTGENSLEDMVHRLEERIEEKPDKNQRSQIKFPERDEPESSWWEKLF